MPKPATHTLLWSEENKTYTLLCPDAPPQSLVADNEASWLTWLATHSSFSFQGQYGHLSVLKESRQRGGGYWYAYHTKENHTRKHYLGRTAMVTLARLEQVAQELSSSSSPALLSRTSRGPEFLQKDVLLSTKLSPPRLPLSLVERSRLLRDLEAVCAYPLILVSASAGSGKTTLLSAWAVGSGIRQREKKAGHKEPQQAIAWLSLDPLDNDPIRFWTSVIAALRTCLPGIGQTALSLLHSPEAPPLSTILTALLNDLAQDSGDITLIFDDYHVISDQSIHDSFLFLLDHLPVSMHLVLATRTDPEIPLSRLRVRGQILEIRSGDLRFTQQEATDFLVQCMRLSLTEEDIATLHRRTEGWIAGLQLAALSLRKRQDRSSWVSDFAGSHRYLLDYIQQDILAGLPIPLQHFLLQTSILARMNAALCQAVTAGAGELANQEMLETLERANLFVVPLDGQRQWYRYHDLFREALRTRLSASHRELVPLLYTRAARWYEVQGEWREAITYALTAPDYPLAASFMEQAAPVFWSSGEASAVQNWVLTLPDSVLRAHIRLAFNAALRFLNSVHLSTEAVHATMSTQVQQTITRIEAILHCQQVLSLGEAEMALIKRRLHLLRALIEVRAYFNRGDKEHLRLLTQELEALPADDEVSWKLIPLTFSFWLALAEQQDSALLVARLRTALDWIREAGDPLVTFRVMTWLARAYIEAGQLHMAHRECLSALTLLEQIDGNTPVAGYLLASLFDIFYAWNRLEEAATWLYRLQRLARDWQQVELLTMGERGAARLAIAQGNLDTAQKALCEAEVLLEREKFATNARWVIDTRVQVWLASHNLASASAWAAQTTLSPHDWDPLRKWEVLLLVRVLLAQQQYAYAVETLEDFREHFDQPTDIEKTLEWMVLSVVALHHMGKDAQAVPVAARLLSITEPEGYVRLYLDAGEPMRQALTVLLKTVSKAPPNAPQEERSIATTSIPRSYVLRLLATFDQEEGRRTHHPGMRLPEHPENRPQLASTEGHKKEAEPLSRQELRVLRLLVAGQTYAEMAEALIVSPNTIKTQVSSIYRKLRVSRRAEAIAVTGQLHLL